VCLGHQAIGQHFGGRVVRAPAPMHGKLSSVEHTGRGVFAGLPSPLTATRYHSLTLDPASFPHDTLEVTATAEDGVIMGLQHKTLPIHGVQFHPESIASEAGHALLLNFLKLADPAAAA
ncbi:MAG: anthranilate synthase component II, partial [Bacteroidota bacterium]